MSNPMWNAILRWSVQHHDPEAEGGAEAAREMSEEDKAFLDKVFRSMVVDVAGRLKQDIMVLGVPESKEGLLAAAEALRPPAEDADIKENEAKAADRAADQARAAATEEEVRRLVIDHKVAALEDVADLCETIDPAVDFCKLGGLPAVLAAVRSRLEPLPEKAAQTLATLVQNNPEVQGRALEAGALDTLLAVLESPDSARPNALAKAMLALSGAVDHHDAAMDAFLAAGGVGKALALAAHGHPRVRGKALVLVRKVVGQRPGTLAAVAAGDALQALASAIGDDNITVRELAAELVQELAEAGGESAAAARACEGLVTRARARLEELRALASEEDRDMCREETEALEAADRAFRA